MRFILAAGLVLTLCFGPLLVRADGGGPLAGQLDRAAALLAERKFDESLAVLRNLVANQSEDRPSAALAQYRIGLYLGWIKEYAKDRRHWLSVVEGELRKVAADFPEQAEAVNLSRVKLADALIAQDKLDDARQVAQALRETTLDRPEYQAWARLKLVEVSLAIRPGMEGRDIRAAQLAAISDLEQIVGMAANDYPEVANWARVRLLGTLAAAWQFEPTGPVCQAVLADHAAGRAGAKQAAWALILRADALTRQNRHEEAIEPLGMAIAVADPNHLDLKYRAEGDLRKVYGALTDREFKTGEQALFKDKDYVTARFHFETAHGHSLLAGGHRLEPIRMHLARLAQRAEEYDRAIAWWRMVIPNPLDLGGGAIEAADVIAWLLREKKNQPEEEKRWRQFLAAPGAFDDPTASIVAAILGTLPATGVEEPVRNVGNRLRVLLALYERENRLPEALAVLQEGVVRAPSAWERASIQGKIAYCLRKLDGEAAAREAAWQAAHLWLGAAIGTDWVGAHYAAEEAGRLFKDLRLEADAITMMDRFIEGLTRAGAAPVKLASARLMRTRALCWNKLFAEAAAAAMELDAELASCTDAGCEFVRAELLVRASGYFAWAGRPETGAELLDTVEMFFPGQYRDWTIPYRQMLNRYLRVEASPSTN